MGSIRARWLGALLLLGTASCSSPTEPAPAGYAGEWVGTTAHGTAVSFNVSGDQVTSFTVAFNLSPTCSGTETIPGPRQIITNSSASPGFVISKVVGDFEWGIAAAAAFSSDRRSATGEVDIFQRPGCGMANFKWSTLRQ